MMGDQPTNERSTGGTTTSHQSTDESATDGWPSGDSAADDWPTGESSDGALLPGGTEPEYDDADECYRLRLDGGEQSLSVAVVGAVAAVAETDPLELQPLRESIDPDALDDLFSGTPGGLTRESGRVEFLFDDYRVVAAATGEIEIRPTE